MIVVTPGYWRISPDTVTMIQCRLPASCAGGSPQVLTGAVTKTTTVTNSTDTQNNTLSTGRRRLETAATVDPLASTFGCAAGYQGPLCSLCSSTYYLDSSTQLCKSCEGQGATQLALMVSIPAAMILALTMGVFMFLTSDENIEDLEDNKDDDMLAGKMLQKSQAMIGKHFVEGSDTVEPHNTKEQSKGQHHEEEADVHNRNSSDQDVAEGAEEQSPTVNETKEKKPTMLHRLLEYVNTMVDLKHIMPKVKILMTVLQIVSSLPSVLDIQFPGYANTLIKAFRYVRCDPSQYYL